jgi:Asp-tRNA(Asn)/Glu-tRNA(Gln) amidotransferase A subunit family amidase
LKRFVFQILTLDKATLPFDKRQYGTPDGSLMHDFFTIPKAQSLLRSGSILPVTLFGHCLQRIEHYEPTVHAWAYLNIEAARTEVQQLDAEAQARQWRGPLHGIPVGIKDIFDVAGMPTACGSHRWKDRIAQQDAPLVAALRAAGAVIIGKTVTTPYAFLDPPITRNPHDLSRTPGGSSSGSAAAVATGMCLAALGSQTGGSLTRPGSYCGVASLKPLHGRLSTEGVLPLAPSLDHVGVFANDVGGVAEVYRVLARSSVVETTPCRWIVLEEFIEELRPELRTKFREAINVHHATAKLPMPLAEVLASHRTIMSYEAGQVHDAWQREFPSDYPQRITELIEDGRKVTNNDLLTAQSVQLTFRAECLMVLGDDGVFVLPAATDVAGPLTSTGDARFNSPWSLAGLPSLGLPCIKDDNGLPLGIQLIGRTEEQLLGSKWLGG